ncbi:MAG: hypothetical protein WKG07_11100 [Hymenobacter sp.]
MALGKAPGGSPAPTAQGDNFQAKVLVARRCRHGALAYIDGSWAPRRATTC